MKRIVNVVETDKDGFEKMLGEVIQVWCVNYIYAGILSGVNESDIVLTDAVVVYETGKLDEKGFKYQESTGAPELFIRLQAIESYSLAPQLVL